MKEARRSEARKGKRDTSSPGGGLTQVDGVPRAGGVGVADRALVPHAVDQVVRHDSPAHRPVPIGGVDRRGVESLQNHIVDDVPSDQVVVALSTQISLAQDLEKKATQTPAIGVAAYAPEHSLVRSVADLVVARRHTNPCQRQARLVRPTCPREVRDGGVVKNMARLGVMRSGLARLRHARENRQLTGVRSLRSPPER